VRTLSRLGKVAFHGIAIAPGETTALGYVGVRPVLLLPGRIDAALAGWLTVGRRMLARLAFRLIEDQPFAAELARKIASPLGLAEVVPVRRRLGRVEPVATTGYLSLQALTRAEGWILVPADSEGHAEGSRVVVRPWP
jgi:molybdopterin biosynthesis enzyme